MAELRRQDLTGSTRLRLLSVILSITLSGLVAAGTTTFLLQRQAILSDVDERLNERAATVAALTTVDPPMVVSADGTGADVHLLDTEYSSVTELLYSAIARMPSGKNETALAVINGAAQYQPSNTGDFDISGQKEAIDTITAEVTLAGSTVIDTVNVGGGTARYIAIPIKVDGDRTTGIYLFAINLNAELSPLATALWAFIIAGLLTLVIVGVISWYALGRVLAPLQSLQTAAHKIAVGDLGSRVTVEGSAEVRDVGRTVNEMLDRIEGSVDAQRQLLDDVRHELKTPITIVRGYLEMMDSNDPEDIETTRHVGISELDRMTRLVQDIDTLATVEGDEYTMGTVDMRALTERVGELVSVIPGHPWRVTQIASAIIRGNFDRLLQAWLALSENAAKYTPEGSLIEIGSSRGSDSIILWVRDHGPGIPPAARHRIFRRFDRGSGKRDVGGSGLGLAIVDVIARAHGGSISVSDTPGGGATFTMHIPLQLGTSTASLPAPVRAGDVVQQWEEHT